MCTDDCLSDKGLTVFINFKISYTSLAEFDNRLAIFRECQNDGISLVWQLFTSRIVPFYCIFCKFDNRMFLVLWAKIKDV